MGEADGAVGVVGICYTTGVPAPRILLNIAPISKLLYCRRAFAATTPAALLAPEAPVEVADPIPVATAFPPVD